ncbi:hypothetical protein [Herpetosiphon geysericola]|uniref:DUF1444 family protein n=1 Tax=Herpetosiphon geysericola TaxID=70996 RepID=A0A0P6XTM2_9CHLR|nr:hypothetical protein [Herpetosiphon geysericola]KPL86652.1 hypothetical protein SE18_11700 [Herpetosiphon geysericola]
MSNWEKTFGKRELPTPPAWVNFFSPQQWQDFCQIVQRYLKNLGLPVRPENQGFVVLADYAGWTKDTRIGLSSLAQKCYAHPQSQWLAVITDHFEAMHKGFENEVLLQDEIDDFESVRDLLAIRLWALEPELREKLIYREDLQDVCSVLVFDLPTTIRSVSSDEAAVWGKSNDELFAIALENLRGRELRLTEHELDDGINVLAITGDDFLIGSQSLLLEHYPQCLGRFGTLVAVPNRHVVLCYPINEPIALEAWTSMLPVVEGMYLNGPGSISNQVFWYDNGTFTHLPHSQEQQSLRLSPPSTFLTTFQE